MEITRWRPGGSPGGSKLANPVKALQRLGVAVTSPFGVQRALQQITSLTPGLVALTQQIDGAILDLHVDVALSCETLELALTHWQKVLATHGEDLRALVVEKSLDGRKVSFSPALYSQERHQQVVAERFRSAALAHRALACRLTTAETRDQAEEAVAEVVLNYFGASRVAVYDVTEDGYVRISHAYLGRGAAQRYNPESHFFQWLSPTEYSGEAMELVVKKQEPYVLVDNPAADPLCGKIQPDGGRLAFESHPFVIISEQDNAGNVWRVYKVDWEKPSDVNIFGRSIQGLFHDLGEVKRRLVLQEQRAMLDAVTQIVSGADALDSILSNIYPQLATFFMGQTEGTLPDSITIMMFDREANALVTRSSWTPLGISQREYFSGPGDNSIGWSIFDLGESIYMRDLPGLPPGKIAWLRGQKGSLIGTPIIIDGQRLGVIVVSSQQQNAFTMGQVRIMEGLANRLGPSFLRINQQLERANLDTKFGDVKFGLKVYHAGYLLKRLQREIAWRERSPNEAQPMALIYGDVDWFKHLNEAWLHADVDYVLAEVFRRLLLNIRERNHVREGEIYRHGGEEIAARLNVSAAEAKLIAERMRAEIERPITVVIPYNDEEAAESVAEKIREGIKKYDKAGIELESIEVVRRRGGQIFLKVTVRKTISLGVAIYRPGDTADSLLHRAEALASLAKSRGRNQVVTEDSLP